MKLPDGDRAHVNRAKITGYLLSLAHPDGRGKAAFFMLFGFRIEQWEVLAETLRLLGCSNPVTGVMASAHGTRYTVDDPLRSADGRAPMVRTVWIAEPDIPGPRLITAYPL